MPYSGNERRRVLSNGIEAEQFQSMDEKTQNWLLYSQNHQVASFLEAHLNKEFMPLKQEVRKLVSFKGRVIIGLLIAMAFLCGTGILHWETVVKYAPKLLLL